jgi:hypothetical protein
MVLILITSGPINQLQALTVVDEITIHIQNQRKKTGKFLGEKFRKLNVPVV